METVPNIRITYGNKIFIKALLVAVLVIVMLIPGLFVQQLVQERKERQEAVVAEVSGKWAGKQTVTGPILMVPYIERHTDSLGKTSASRQMAFVIPEELYIDGNIDPRVKKRSLYNVNLYQGNVQLSGKFPLLTPELLGLRNEDILWADARLAINVTDMRGIDEQITLDWNGAKQVMAGGVPANPQFDEGVNAPVSISPGAGCTFSAGISMRGSGMLYFAPVGKTTTTRITAKWKDPAFDGQYLPATSETNGDSFTAKWKVLPSSYGYAQAWKNGAQAFENTAFGVRLIEAVDGYSKTMRAVKYAILFIALTFAFFFFLEILKKRRVHPIQYLLVGMALSIFYTLLLSLSEYIGFNAAYAIAAIATIALISSYVSSIFSSRTVVVGFAGVLAALYGYIYIIIGSEDYALLFGSIGLFVTMAIIMHFSRRIDWYGGSAAAPATT